MSSYNYVAKEKKFGWLKLSFAIHRNFIGLGFNINASNANIIWVELTLLVVNLRLSIK